MSHGSLGCGCAFALVSMAMMPVTCSSGWTVPGALDLQRMKTASQVFQVLRIWNGIGAWPLCPAMNALREVKVGVPSYIHVSISRCLSVRSVVLTVAGPFGQPLLMSSFTLSE